MSVTPKKHNLGLNTDKQPIEQPQGTYRFALNAVNEVFDGNQSSISNERANEACGYIPLDHVFLHSLIIDNERTLIFSVSEDESISEIGLFTHSKCEYEELIRTSCLGFRLKNLLDSTYRLRRNCEETAYFTDGKEEVKRINISDLSEYYSEAYKQWLDNPIGTYIGEKWNCNKMNLFPSYKIPCINKLEVKTGGDIPPGTYNFAVQLLNKDREGTPFIYSSQLVPIYNDDPSEGYWHIQGSSHIDADDLGGGSNSNKTITFELDNLDSNYSYYRIAVIGADNGSGDVSRVYYSPDFKINKTGSNVFLYDGNLQGYTNGSVEEVKATKDNYKTASHIEQSNNRLLLADLKGYDYPWCSFQQYASKIVSNFITKDFKAQDANDLGNPKNPNTYFLNRGYQGGDVYAFGIVYVFKNGLESPVYHIPGRPLDKWYDIRNQNIVATNLPDTLLSTDPQDYEFLDPGDTPERYKVYDTSQPVPALNYGGMAYHQSEVSKYDDRLDCNGLDFWGVDFTNTPLKDTPLRHHKFPSRGNLETRQALGGDDINTSSAVVLNLFYQDGVTAFPSGVTTITVTINYFVNSIAQTPIVLNVVEADMEIIDQILATHPVGTWLITGISVVITGLANPELTFDVGAYVRSESQEWNTNSAGRLLGIEFDNIDYPHPDIVGHYFVRGDRDEANRTVIDSGIMGNLRVGQPQAIKYSTFSYFTNNDNGIADDKRHNYLFTPKFLYKRESKKGDYIRLENHFDFASGSISSETYDESGSGVREVDISIATRVQTYSGGTLHAGAAGQNWKIIRQVVLDGATYNDGTFQNGTRTYNISQSNRLQAVSFNYDFPKFGWDIAYVTVRRNAEVHPNLDSIKYYRTHDCELNNLTPNKIWGGDTFITHMNMSNTCYLGLKKGKTALIVGILLIVVAVVITVVSFGAATPLGAALGAAGSAIAIGVTIAAGVLGITTQVLEVMHQNRETGLDAFENDNILDNSIGGNGSTALKYGCEHLRGILVESEFNTELRQEFSLQPNSFWKYDIGVAEYFRDKIVYYDSGCDKKKAKKSNGQWNCFKPRGVVTPEIYHYNLDYSRENREKVYFPLDSTYDCCSECRENFPNRIAYSQVSFQEELEDNFKIFLPNNYRDVEAEMGPITDLFTKHNELYVHAENALYHIPQNIQERVTGDLLTFIGTGEYLGVPERKLLEGRSAGTKHKTATTKTRQGVIFLSEEEGKVYLFDNKMNEISNIGERNFFENNLKSFINEDFLELADIEFPNQRNPHNPVGTGYSVGYDRRFNRIIITKKDFRIAESYRADFQVYDSSKTSIVALTHTILVFDLFDNKFYLIGTNNSRFAVTFRFSSVFENHSWSKSFSFHTKTWISYHSYLPYAYINQIDEFFSLKSDNRVIAKHNSINRFTTYHGITYPFIFEPVHVTDPMNDKIHDDFKIDTVVKEYLTTDVNSQNYTERDDITFNQAMFYNHKQNSGYVVLNPRNNNDPDYLTKRVNNNQFILVEDISREEGHWNFNSFRDYVEEYGLPMFVNNWADIQSDYYIDKVLNQSKMNYNKHWSELQPLRDKYLICRLIFRNFGLIVQPPPGSNTPLPFNIDRFQITVNYFMQNETPSIR